MGQLSLPKNFNGLVSLVETQFQLTEFLSKLEDHLNDKVDIHLVESKGPNSIRTRPTFKKGDIIFDFTITPGVATLQQWDGKRLITFNLANFEGFINLLTQANGSGNNPTLYLRSDGNDRWVLDSPSKIDTFDIVATENLPARSLVTTNGKVADSNTLSHFNHVVGLNRTPILTGNVATVVVEGEVTDGTWVWVNNDKLFLNGTTLSTVPPTSGFSQFIALAKNSETIFVRLQIPVLF